VTTCRTTRRVALCVCLSFLAATEAALAADVSPLARLSFEPSMQAGFSDAQGNYVAGTEVMHLVPYRGRLYAGTSLWMEKDPDIAKACQVLVLDSPRGRWRVEHQFTKANLRLGSLKAVTFRTDGKGNRVPPMPMLLAAPDVARGPVAIFVRDEETGRWLPSVLGSAAKYTTTRAVGFHRDSVTGVDHVLAGTDTLGILAGTYDAAAPAHIRWAGVSEMKTPEGERVMGFCDCNGAAYCATSRHIYRRRDSRSPSWQEVYFCPEETKPCGIRGLTAVPDPHGRGEVLWFAALSRVRRLDPADGFKETVELRMPAFLGRRLGVPVAFALAAYDELLPVTLPDTGEIVWLFGFESSYPRAFVETVPPPKLQLLVHEGHRWYFAAEARYFVRHAKGPEVSYEVAQVTDPRQPTLVSVRAIAVSPFAEDRGRAFYFAGFDCNSVPSHNTAWIYRGEMRSK
jgi:hypothetical protein